MFNLFKKKEEPIEIPIHCWQKEKVRDARWKIDSLVEKNIKYLLKELSEKIGLKDIDEETLQGLRCWVDPDSLIGYGLLIYACTTIMEKLSHIESLLDSKEQSNYSND